MDQRSFLTDGELEKILKILQSINSQDGDELFLVGCEDGITGWVHLRDDIDLVQDKDKFILKQPPAID